MPLDKLEVYKVYPVWLDAWIGIGHHYEFMLRDGSRVEVWADMAKARKLAKFAEAGGL